MNGPGEDEDALTGQTGSGQARPTPGGAARPDPRDRNGAPPSGSYLGPQPPVNNQAGGCNKAVCRVAVCSLFSRFVHRRYALNSKYALKETHANGLTQWEVPVRGITAESFFVALQVD
jgi:hypothetical protein